MADRIHNTPPGRLGRLAWIALACWVASAGIATADMIVVHHSQRVTRVENRPKCVNGFCRIVPTLVESTVSHWGSGVIIGCDPRDGGKLLALTAAHVVQGTSNVQVRTKPRGKWLQAVVVARKYTQAVDVALLSFADDGSTARGLADRNPSQGEQAHTWGAGADQVYHTRHGYVSQVGPKLWTANTPVRDGESGGPVVDANGKIVGIINSTDGGQLAISTPVASIRPWLREVLGTLPGETQPETPPETVDVNADWKRTHDQTIRNKALILAMKSDGEKIVGLIERQTATIEALQRRLDELESRKPERGPAGPQGERGERGPAGTAASVDLSAITRRLDALESRTRRVIVKSTDGSVIDQAEYSADEPIVIRYKPIRVGE